MQSFALALAKHCVGTCNSLRWHLQSIALADAIVFLKQDTNSELRNFLLTKHQGRIDRSGLCPTNCSGLNPNRSLDYYALTNFLFVICLSVFRLQWNPIAPSRRRDICSKTRVVIIITLMTIWVKGVCNQIVEYIGGKQRRSTILCNVI